MDDDVGVVWPPLYPPRRRAPTLSTLSTTTVPVDHPRGAEAFDEGRLRSAGDDRKRSLRGSAPGAQVRHGRGEIRLRIEHHTSYIELILSHVESNIIN